jgi:hypothetical protein
MAILYPCGYPQLDIYYPLNRDKKQMIFWLIHSLSFNNSKLSILNLVGTGLAHMKAKAIKIPVLQGD